MRRSAAIVKATALEILSEPLSMLLLLSALALAVLAPAFHYHQFGEPTRMAVDAGLSALLTGGLAFAVFGTIRVFRREIESGTFDMALAHPVSRGGFFLAKTSGALVAYLLFAFILSAATVTVVNGAAIGGRLAEADATIARLWGPSFACAVAVAVVPPVVAAMLNRFARFRFVLSFFVIAALTAFASLVYRPDPALALRLLPALLSEGVYTAVMLTAAAAFAVRFRANAAASAVALSLLVSLPFIGNYYLADALSKGGAVTWSYLGFATLAALPAAAGFLVAGIVWSSRLGGED